MNDSLKSHARKILKENLAECTVEQQQFFKRMYSHKDLNKPIDDVVDSMSDDKLDWAITQVETSLAKSIGW